MRRSIVTRMRILKGLLGGRAYGRGVRLHNFGAVTRVPSADGQFWDIQDTSPWAQDSGGIATGGRANPFNGFGYLKLQVRRADNSLLVAQPVSAAASACITTAPDVSIRSRRC